MGCIPVMCPYWLITFTLNWVMWELFPVEFTTVISLSTDTCSISGEWRPASVSSTCFCVIQSSSMLAVLGWNSFIQPWSPGYITFLSKRTCLMLGRGITANYMYLYPCSYSSLHVTKLQFTAHKDLVWTNLLCIVTSIIMFC